MRKEKARSVFLSTLGLLITFSLMTGCYRPAAPDVTPTPAGAAEAVETGEGMPDQEILEATALAEAARATQAAEEGAGEASPTKAPTDPAPTQTPTSSPASPTPEPATPVPTVEPEPDATASPSEQITHVVQHGENLFRIALRYGTTVEAIASANNITNPALISVGQKLVVHSSGTQPPSPAGETTYVVQPGDNLFRIALRYNLSYLYLAQYNNIANPSNIHTGQVLNIPPH